METVSVFWVDIVYHVGCLMVLLLLALSGAGPVLQDWALVWP